MGEPTLQYYYDGENLPKLVYDIWLSKNLNAIPKSRHYRVNAMTGDIVSIDTTSNYASIVVLDGTNDDIPTGKNQITSNSTGSAVNLNSYFTNTLQYFNTQLKYDKLDGTGLQPLESFDANNTELIGLADSGDDYLTNDEMGFTNHNSTFNYKNLSGQTVTSTTPYYMYFGAGGPSFENLSKSQHVVAHEVVHGIDRTIGPDLSKDEVNNIHPESAALNESILDIIALGVDKQIETDESDLWKLGEEVSKSSPAVVRYANNPALKSGHTDYYSDYDDGKAGHINSGISTLAFYKMVKGGRHPQGKSSTYVPPLDANNLTNSINKGVRIFYNALVNHMNANETFADAMEHTAQAAINEYGYKSDEHLVVCAGWLSVGVPNSSSINCNDNLGGSLPSTYISLQSSCNGPAVQITANYGVTSSSLDDSEYYMVQHRSGKVGSFNDIYYGQDASITDIYANGDNFFRVYACNVFEQCSAVSSTFVNKDCGGSGGGPGL